MKYAIVESGGKQYRAVEGGTLEVDRLPVEAGANVKLEQILLLADGESITVGTPVVKDSPVWTTVIEHFKGEKVVIFNYSPKKRIRVKTGHRQNYTRLLVEQIGGSELVKREPVKKAEKVVEAKAEAESPKVKVEKPVQDRNSCPEGKETGRESSGKVSEEHCRKEQDCSSQNDGKETRQGCPKPAAKKTATKKPSAAKK